MKRHLARGLAAAALAMLAGCAATPIAQPIDGYACCNLRTYYGDWVSSHNVLGGPMVPLGTAAHFGSIKKTYYVYGTLGGSSFGLRYEHGRTEADTLAWANRVIVAEDPRKQLAAWPADVQAAVNAGHVVIGMTRPQVLMSLGYPDPESTPQLEAPQWRYWTAADDSQVLLQFGDDGLLQDVQGTASAVRTVRGDA